MSSRKKKNSLVAPFCEEEGEQSDVGELCEEEVMLDDIDDEIKHERCTIPSPVVQTYSLDTALKCRETPAEIVRDRSRSPIVKVQPASDPQPSSSAGFAVLEWVFGDDEQTYSALDIDDLSEDNLVEDQRLATDAHAEDAGVSEGSDMKDMNVEAKGEGEVNVKAGVLSGRGERVSRERRHEHVRSGTRVGGNHQRGGDQRSQGDVSNPLEEIWARDEDVPSELKDLDEVRKRELRALEIEKAMKDEKQREIRGEVNENKDEEDKSLLFEWCPMETFRRKEELFTPEITGSVQRHWSPYDAFRSIWDDSILNLIADSTNQNASNITSSAFQTDWYPTSAHEVLCLFAFWIMLGIVRMPTISCCFSRDPLLRTDVFRKIFTAPRYTALTRALNFANPVDPTNTAARSDLLYPVKPIITSLNAKFQANYVPSQDICIDESVTHWKGPQKIFRQYIPSKDANYGIKTVELCESATGYLWSFTVYTGKEEGSTIVKKLVNPLLNKGYRLFLNTWYNSPSLARFLKRNGTDCVGTLRPYRQDVPFLIDKAPLKKGQLVARHSGDVCVMSWQDNKRINMISTCHGSAAGLARVPSKPAARSLTFKPQIVLDYDRSMGGVDLKDQMLEPYLLERKNCSKWYMKFFKRLLNVSISNARILMESSLQCPQDHHNFRLRLVDTILHNHLSLCPQHRRHGSAMARLPDPIRKVPHIHWPVRVEEAEGYASRNRKTRVRCSVCIHEGRKTVKTPFKCEACNVPLCVDGCFKKYHVS